MEEWTVVRVILLFIPGQGGRGWREKRKVCCYSNVDKPEDSTQRERSKTQDSFPASLQGQPEDSLMKTTESCRSKK